MSLITKMIHHQEYMLFEGGYTKEQAKKRVQQLRVMVQSRKRGDGSSARTVPYEGQYAVFIRITQSSEKA